MTLAQLRYAITVAGASSMNEESYLYHSQVFQRQ